MSDELQILSVCRTLPTPVNPVAGSFVFNRIAAMSRQAQVSIVQPVPYLPVLRPLAPWARARHRSYANVRIEHAPMLYVPGALKQLDGRWLARSIDPIVRRSRVENAQTVLDAHFGYPDGVGCAQVATRLGVPYFITVRGLEVDVLRTPMRSQLLAALNEATGCISVSHSLRDLMIQNGVPGEQIAVIPNAIDGQIFKPGDRQASRAALGIPAGVPLIVSVGNLLHVKRHDVLLQAFKVFARKHPDAMLAVIGGAAHEPATPARLSALSAELGLSGAVTFHGALPAVRVATWLQAADLFSLASDREGCCNAVLESLAVGTPVVATHAGDNAAYVKQGVSGSTTAIGDAEALGEALLKGYAHPWNRLEISRTLHAAVGGWADVASRVLGFFRQRLAEAAARAVTGAAA